MTVVLPVPVPGTELDFEGADDLPSAAGPRVVDDVVAGLAEDAVSLAAGLPAFAAVDFVDLTAAFLGAALSSFAGVVSVFFGSAGSAIGKSRSQTSGGPLC